MRRPALRAFLLWALCWPFFPAAAAPRLLVVVSVAQMRADYLDLYALRFSSGLKSLYERGAVWTNAHYAHAPTETAPGHATIMTGKAPDRHGVVANEWWDRRASSAVYCVADSIHGLGPENLATYALGDALKAKDPLSRVVSLSMKDRAAILMGGKKADLALWYDHKTGEFKTSSYYGAKPAWVDAFNARGKAPGAALAAGRYDILATPLADRLLLDLIEEAVSQQRLGDDDHPDILAVSFSATDYIGHKYGPDGPQMKKQILELDLLLGELIGYLKASVGEKNFDLVLTADHGVLPVPESAAGKEMGARRVAWAGFSAEVEKALQRLNPAPGQKWTVVNAFPHLYLNRELAAARGDDWPLFLREAAKVLRVVEGIAQVYVPGEWGKTDPYAEVYRRSYYPGRSGDLIFRPAEGVLVSQYKDGTDHSTPYPYDTHVPLIFWGPDFRTGLFGRAARVQDLAPTCARVLGVDFPAAEGSRVLSEAFPRH